MHIKNNYKATVAAAFLGYITQAIMLNFPPLLYIFFQSDYGLSLSQVSFLITANIVVELVVDIIVSKISIDMCIKIYFFEGEKLCHTYKEF